MQIRRTANAGILLTLDGKTVLLDGACREEYPYPATPPQELALLRASWPDVIAFTHMHNDHYDPDFAADYKKQENGVILGPASLPGATAEPVNIGNLKIMAIPSRHIGAAGKTTDHVSFLIMGTKTVLFTGDATPLGWRNREDLPQIDVVAAPYAYAATPSALEIVRSLGAKELVILHLPERGSDPYDLWSPVEATVKGSKDISVYIPEMSETILL